MTGSDHSTCDYVIVGAGSAGCVLASRLTEDGKRTVLLLEAGPEDRYVWIHIPIGYAKTMFHPVYNWMFYTEPEPNMKKRKVYWPCGRGLGGSSSINGLIYRLERGRLQRCGHRRIGRRRMAPATRARECAESGDS